jgi:hypothetical protein
MSYFYLRSDFFGDGVFSAGSLGSAGSFGSLFQDNQYLIVSSENFNNSEFIRNISTRYLQTINVINNGSILYQKPLGLANNGAAFDVLNLYLLSTYKSGQLNCISEDTRSTLSNAQLKNPFYINRVFLLGDDKTTSYTVLVYSYEGVVVNKAYHRMLPSGDGSSATMLSINMTAEEIQKVPTNNIYTNYSNCKVLNLFIQSSSTEGLFYYKNLIIIEDKSLDYLEDFSGKFYYDAGTQRYYLDDTLTECSIKVYDYYHPYILLVSPDVWASKSVFHGPVKLQLETTNDTTLDDSSSEISYLYVNICNSSTTVANNNTISCTSNAGEVSVNVNGVIKLFDDQQICPIDGAAKTVIAVFSLKPLETLTLYKDFSSITTVKSDVWGYNFRYIKYYDGTNYYSFKDNGSVASATVHYIDETLDLSKYFSIKEVSDGLTLSDAGKIKAITLAFKVYKVATTDADATDYYIDIPINVLSPEIISIEEDTETSLITIKTNYATRLTYKFNEASSVSINVADTADGTNQTTVISSSGKFGTFYCKAFNYYYDFQGLIRQLYSSEEKSLELIRTITIPSFTLTVKIGASTKTIYDSQGGSQSSLAFTNLAQDAMYTYTVYSDYITNTGDYTFQLAYSLSNTQYSSMFLRLGNDPTLHPMILSGGVSKYVISKKDLFESLDVNNGITLSFLADKKVAFDFPFTFLNTSQANLPVCNAFSLSTVQLTYPQVSIGFTLSYTYADEIQYSVIDQDGNILNQIVIRERFRDIESYFLLGTTRQRTIQVNNLVLNESVTSLRVSATASNLYSAADPTRREDTEISSPTYYLPLKIGEAEVVLYSDSGLTNELTEIVKGEEFWAFLRIKDIDGNIVSLVNYSNYIAQGYKPEIFILESRGDANNDLEGVTSSRVDNYTFKFTINNGSKFDDTTAVFQAQYIPVIDPEIV